MNLSFGFVLAVFAAFAAAIISEWRGVSATAIVPGDDDRWYTSGEAEAVPSETPAESTAEVSEAALEDLEKDRNLALPNQPR